MTAPENVTLNAIWLGREPFERAFRLQQLTMERLKSGDGRDTVLLLEHDHVYTMGRRSAGEDILSDRKTLSERGIDVVETDRGGETTYHGPGQLVAYPIVGIRVAGLGPVSYVRILEEAIIQTLDHYGVRGHRVVGKTGVWVGGEPGAKPAKGELPEGKKIAAIGVRVSRGIAMHGMSLNVSTDLSYYDGIVPCGMPGLDVTSIEREIGKCPKTRSVAEEWAPRFADLFMRRISWLSRDALDLRRSAKASIPV